MTIERGHGAAFSGGLVENKESVGYETDFDLDSPEFRDRFDEVSQEVLAKCPVAGSPMLGGYKVVFRDEDIRAVASDWETFSNRFGFEPTRSGDDDARLYPLEIDPPYQAQWRSALGSHLGARTVVANEGSVRAHANDLIDGFIEAGRCDFVDQYAALLPGRVFFSTILHVPLEDLSYVQQATDDAVRVPIAEGETVEDYAAKRQNGWNRVADYLEEYMRKREEEPPRNDIVDAILQGVEMDDGEPTPWKHKLFVMLDMMGGGLATTSFALSGMANFLATKPRERARLESDPSLHENAIEELLRYYASVLAIGRTATKDTVVAGQEVRKGEMLMLAYSVGCRDPRIYESPDVIDIDRPIKSNLAFGWGSHRCPGNSIAKLQMRVTLTELLRRVKDLEAVATEGPQITHSTISRNWETLPLRFAPGEVENDQRFVEGG
jgi:cytochrome P450